MSRGTKFQPEQLQLELQTIAAVVRALAQRCQGNSLDLVRLLRLLEELHREIRDGIFQAALPDNRQALYNLLKDIETEGGWPYIERMRLQAFLANLPVNPPVEVEDQSESGLGTKAAADGETGKLRPE